MPNNIIHQTQILPKKKKKNIIKWLFIGVLGFFYSLGEGATGAASSVTAVPVMFSITGVVLKGVVLGFGIGSFITNFYIMFRALPDALSKLHKLFFKGGFKKYSGKQKIAFVIGSILTLTTSAMIGAFATASVSGSISGIAALFGVTLMAAAMPWLAPVAIIAGVIGAIAFGALIITVIINIIENAGTYLGQKLKRLSEYLSGKSKLTGVKKFQHTGKLIFALIGAVICTASAIFTVLMCAPALAGLLTTAGLSVLAVKAITFFTAYVAGASTLIAFGLRNAVNVFGNLGKGLGWLTYHILCHPIRSIKNVGRTVGRQCKAAGSLLIHSPGKFIGNTFKLLGKLMIAVFAVGSMTLNTTRSALLGSKGDSALHKLPFFPSANPNYHNGVDTIGNNIAQGVSNPFNGVEQAGLTAAETGAIAISGINSGASIGNFALDDLKGMASHADDATVASTEDAAQMIEGDDLDNRNYGYTAPEPVYPDHRYSMWRSHTRKPYGNSDNLGDVQNFVSVY